MALSDHLRELRARVLRILVALVLGIALCLVFFDYLYELVLGPYNQARQALGTDVTSQPTINGVGGPLMTYLKLSGFAGVILTSPYWLHQIWAFILPGLHPGERKWSRVFAAIAGPLFIIGVVVGYLTLPKGLEVLIGFTREGLTNLVEFNDYVTFFTRTLLAFGVSFEIPVFIVLLNLVGVLPARTLATHRAWFIVGIFVFAAVVTPSTDPFTMLFLAVPMCLLFFIAELVCRVLERRKKEAQEAGPGPDEASVL
ncbi:twin-arginine translocase subunit TatC [Nocardioides rotundus]|nr:twin-arginine translocase subunit TatC [Nocardioides rotundus]